MSSKAKLPDVERLIQQHHHIVLFDGECNLCSGWVKFLIQRDPQGQFSFCAVQSRTGKMLLQYCGLPTDSIETMVFIHCGKPFVRSAGCLEVLKCLPVPWRWLSVLLVIPTSIRDWFYNLIARNRYRVWGKSSLCLMPSTETQGRFL